MAVRDPDGSTDTATVTITVSGGERPERRPARGDAADRRRRGPTIGGFARRGLRMTLRCGEVDGEALARVRVSGKAARKLGRRTLATRAIACAAGRRASRCG